MSAAYIGHGSWPLSVEVLVCVCKRNQVADNQDQIDDMLVQAMPVASTICV